MTNKIRSDSSLSIDSNGNSINKEAERLASRELHQKEMRKEFLFNLDKLCKKPLISAAKTVMSL